MNAIVLEEPGRLAFAAVPEPPAPGPGEALVAVRRVGICGTDLHAYRGRQPFSYPRILGHELGVDVLAVGPGVDDLRPGDRCAVEPYLDCGTCIACRRGRPNCCAHLRTLGVHTDGGLRERIVLPARKLHPSAILSHEQLALIETLGIGAHAVDRAAPGPDDTILIRGAGPIGLAVAQFARLTGARVIVSDVNPERLAFCGSAIGVDHLVDARDDALGQVAALTDGDLPTVVVEATGNAESMAGACEAAAHGGRVVFVGLITGSIPIPDPLLHRRELTLLASRNATPADFRRLLDLAETGRIDTRPWITHRLPWDAAIDRFPLALDPATRTIKAVIELS